MKISLRFLFNAGLGAAAMYYFDPDRGPERRTRLRDRLEHGEDRALDAGPANPRPGRTQPPQEHSEFMQDTWSPAVRATAGVAGGTAALYGLGRGGFRGTLLGAAGLLLLARATTNTGLRRLLGIGGPRHASEAEADRARAKGGVERGRMPGHATPTEGTPEQPGPVH